MTSQSLLYLNTKTSQCIANGYLRNGSEFLSVKMTRFHFSNRLGKKMRKSAAKKGSKASSSKASTHGEGGGREEVMSNMVLQKIEDDPIKSCSSSSGSSSFDVASDITQGSVERIFQVPCIYLYINILFILIEYIFKVY